MDVKNVEKHYRIEIKSSSNLIQSLLFKIHANEEIYEMRSSQMLFALRNNKAEETKDICNWMHDYRTLKQLRNGKNGV